MRRIFLLLTLLSIATWSQQPAQQQAQLPPVVRVEMPQTNPPNPWVRLVELLLPGIIGGGIAFFGVWLTNRNNARQNDANRQHQLEVEVAKAKIAAEYRSKDNRWEFQKNVYVKLLTSITDIILALARINELQPLSSALPDNSDLQKRLEVHRTNLLSASATFSQNASLAPLAVANSVLPVVMTLEKKLPRWILSDPDRAATNQTLADFNVARDALQEAGRKDLWGDSELEAADAKS